MEGTKMRSLEESGNESGYRVIEENIPNRGWASHPDPV